MYAQLILNAYLLCWEVGSVLSEMAALQTPCDCTVASTEMPGQTSAFKPLVGPEDEDTGHSSEGSVWLGDSGLCEEVACSSLQSCCLSFFL